jgi:hypothetical protein
MLMPPSKQIKVVALDPGVTTGVSIGVIDQGCMIILTGQQKLNHKGLYDGIVKQAPDHLICERFEFRKKARPGLILYSRELIGICNLYVQQHVSCTLHMQQPSQGIGGFWTDTQLKKDKVYKAGNPHANDSVRHLLEWYVFGPGYKYNKKGYVPGW